MEAKHKLISTSSEITPPTYIKSKEIVIGVFKWTMPWSKYAINGCDYNWIDNNIFVIHSITTTKQHLDPKSCGQFQWPNEYNIPSLEALHPTTTPCPNTPFQVCAPTKPWHQALNTKKSPTTKKHKMILDHITRTITHNKKFEKQSSKFQNVKSKSLHHKIQRP